MSDDSGSYRHKKFKVRSNHTLNKGFSITWLITTVVLTFILSITISLITTSLLNDVTLSIAFVILFIIILLGIVFDIIGIAVTAAIETPFHAMASRRIAGANFAIRLIRNSEKVSNVCNDVVGDICGIVSGATGTVIVAELTMGHSMNALWVSLLITGLIAALTVGGKAAGKTIAISNCNAIVFSVGRLLYFTSNLKGGGRKK